LFVVFDTLDCTINSLSYRDVFVTGTIFQPTMAVDF
jgi:hypothetical protein